MKKFIYISGMLLTILCICLVISSRMSNNEIEQIDGKIILIASLDSVDNEQIYEISGDSSDIKIFSRTLDYKYINDIGNYHNKIVCVFIDENHKGILQISEDNVKEILEIGRKESLINPVLLNDEEIIYTKKTNDGYFLYKYSLTSNNEIKLSDSSNINTRSLPTIDSKGNVFFVTETVHVTKNVINNSSTTKYSYKINRLNTNGEVSEVIEGYYPVLINDNEIIYYHNRSLYKYNHATKKSKKIKRNILITEQPVLSPNKTKLAFIDPILKGNIPVKNNLKILDLNNKHISELSLDDRFGVRDVGRGLVWLQ